MNDSNMASHKRINITLHPIELKKLDSLAREHHETRSGMIARLIQSYNNESFVQWVYDKDEREKHLMTDKK